MFDRIKREWYKASVTTQLINLIIAADYGLLKESFLKDIAREIVRQCDATLDWSYDQGISKYAAAEGLYNHYTSDHFEYDIEGELA